jgi:predicted negative regulator of RcsB-dependent stress response
MSGGAQAAMYITLGVLLIIGGTTAVIVWSWHRLQQHRADAVAMAAYRKLAEEAVANQQELRDEMRKLAEAVAAVEQLMRDVG